MAETAALLADSPEASSETLDIVLVSDNLPDYQMFVDAAHPDAQVIVYDGDTESAEDVIKRVSAVSIENDRPVNSLTVFSHGEEGAFNLGNEEISAENIDENANAWAELDAVMADDGHIYVFGCNVGGESDENIKVLDRLAEATGAHVFASDDITGRDGDWDLESASDGADSDEADPPVDLDVLDDYAFNLTSISVPVQIASFEDQPGSYGIFIYGQGENAGSRTAGSVSLEGSTPALFTNATVEYNGWITNDPRTIDGQLVSAYHQWSVDFDPVQHQNGQATLNFDVDGSDFDTLVTILPVNDPPVAFDDSITTPEDTPITDTLQGDDPVEGDPITFEIVTGPEHGTITNFNPNTGQYTYVPDQDYFGPDSFTFRVDDNQSQNNLSEIATVDITVTPVPDKPEVETSEGNADYIENDPPVVVDPLVELSDVDSDTLTGATVQITQNYQNDARGQDILRFTDQSGITGTWQAGTGTLTLTGTATLAQYQAALRTVSFEHIGGVQDGDDPNENVRTVSFTVTDDTDLTSDPATRGVFVDAINDAPDLTPETGIVTYLENCGPIDLGDFQVDDVDDENMTRAEIRITEGYVRGEDILQFNDTADITGTWNSSTGTLTLTGTASEAAYAAALASVTYNNTGDEVDPGSRQITITIRDANSRGVGDGPGGGFKTDSVTRTLDIEINEPPVLDLDSTDGTPEDGTPPPPVDFQTTYPVGSDGVLLTDSGIVLDSDDTQLSALQVEIRNMGNGDVLNFNADGTNISGNYNPSTGTLLLSGVDSIQNYQQVLNTITYSNSNDTFSEDQIYTREIEFQATDNGGNTCAIKDSNVAVAFVDILPGPTVEDVDDINTFIENCGPVLIAETA
ncbi:MAG: DUF4347 domain-containing protein, partial [Thermodesulfobacteriota bacterium]